MPRRQLVDAAEAVRLSKEGKTAAAIALVFGCQTPAIYRAFNKMGHVTETMLAHRAKVRKFNPTSRRVTAIAIPEDVEPIAPRDPCQRCGTRGDIGCRHTKAPLGWAVG